MPDLKHRYGSHITTEDIPRCVTEAQRQKPVTPSPLNTSFLPACTTKLKDCSCKKRDLHLHTRNGFPQQWLGSASAGTQLPFVWLQKEPFCQEFTASFISCQSAPASFHVLTRHRQRFPLGSWFLCYILGQGLTIINKQ